MTKLRFKPGTRVEIESPRRRRTLPVRVLAFTVAVAVVAGCTSPESTRVQAGGPGADTGNRSEVLRMHEGSNPFIGTPDLNPTQSPPMESASHARDRSMR